MRSTILTMLVLGLATGCASWKGGGTTATSFMRTVRSNPDPNLRYQAYVNLASPDCYDNQEQKAEAATPGRPCGVIT